MTRHEFCTLFDHHYLPRGLVLYRSLMATGAPFRLRVFCMDGKTKVLLERLALPCLVPIGLDELEAHDPDLLSVKPTRTQVEYCWTATPAVCLYCLERDPELKEITYLDADLMFFRDPREIFDECGDASVLIVPHRFPRRWRHWEETKGVYNVQFLTFRRDDNGLKALRWWHERCLEWCFNRLEDGKLGDQKYLDEWPTRFSGVHVLAHPGAGVAPWNVRQYDLAQRNGAVTVDGRPLVFYHFHSLRLYRSHWALRFLGRLPTGFQVARESPPLVWSSSFHASRNERRLIWDPYVVEVGRALEQLAQSGETHLGLETVEPARLARRAVRQAIPPALRRPLSVARHQARRLHPDGIAAFARWRYGDWRTRFRDSWKSAAVAEQMHVLTEHELRDPHDSDPYRAFIEAVQTLLAEFDLPEPARFLDFGCGTGHYSELLERYFPDRFSYLGCDYSEEMIALARTLWPRRQFAVNDIYDNHLDLGAFDIVCPSCLVDVLPDVDKALDVVLGSGARFVLLHRQRITRRSTHVELAPAYRGQKTYRSYLNVVDLERFAVRHGRVISHAFHVRGDVHTFLLPRSEGT